MIEARLPAGQTVENEAFEMRTRKPVPPRLLRVMDDSELPFELNGDPPDGPVTNL